MDLTLERFLIGCALRINGLTRLTLISVLQMYTCPKWSMTVLYNISCIINAKASLLTDICRYVYICEGFVCCKHSESVI